MLLKCCLNGGRTPSEHPGVPITPAQLAVEAQAAAAAGAGAVHLHPRGADGAETLASEPCAAAIEAVRVAAPGLPIGLSTGQWIAIDVDTRHALIQGWTVWPDFVSVNFSEDGLDELCALIMLRGSTFEAGLASVADAKRLVKSGLAERCLRILIEIDDATLSSSEAMQAVAQIDAVLDGNDIGSPRLYHGMGMSTWPIVAEAMRRGRDVRIGLEDVLTLPDGAPARDNAELVRAALALA